MKRNAKLILATLLVAVTLLGMASPAFASSTEYVQATEAVNIRTGPGTNYALIGWLQPNAVVIRTGRTGNWTKINLGNGREGYVASAYLRTVTNVNPNYVGQGIVFEDGTVVTGTPYYATTALNLRKGPGTSYDRIGWLEKGERVGVISVSDKWAKVNWNGTVCYAFFQYLAPVSGGIVQDTPVPVTGTRYYATTALNLRKGPGTSYARIGWLEKGEGVTVLSVDGKWARVDWNGTKCYAFFAYLEKGYGTTVGYNVTTADVTAYYGPGAGYERAGSLLKGTRVEVLGTVGSWSMIPWDDSVAYIPTQYIANDIVVSRPGVTVAGYYYTLEDVDVYRGPGTGYAMAGTLLKGVRVQVIALSGNWAVINLDDQALYVKSSSLALQYATGGSLNNNGWYTGSWGNNWENNGWGNKWNLILDDADDILASFVVDNRSKTAYGFKGLKTIYVPDPPKGYVFDTEDFAFSGSQTMTVVFRDEDAPSTTAQFIWYRNPYVCADNYSSWGRFASGSTTYYFREHPSLGYSEAYWWRFGELFYASVPYYFTQSEAAAFFRSLHKVSVD